MRAIPMVSEKQRLQFYALFYFCVYAGSLISNFVSPLLRTYASCFGEDSCYPLAFGVRAVFMVIALVVFLIGHSFYKIHLPQENIFVNVMQIIGRAIRQRFSNGSKRDHWLDYADDKYDKKLIADIKSLYRVCWIYFLLPMYWSISDQQCSQWTLQATRMDGHLGFINFTVPPDQMCLLNPLFYVCFIPFTEIILYPLFNKCGILKKPLQRVCFGGVLSALSFFIAALLQFQLEKTLPIPIKVDNSRLTIINSLPCTLKLNFNKEIYQISPLTNRILEAINSNMNYTGTAIFSRGNFTDCPLQKNILGKFSIYPESQKAYTLAFGLVDNSISCKQEEDPRDKADNGKSNVRFIYNLQNPIENTSVTLESTSGVKNYSKILSEYGSRFGLTDFIESIEPDIYKIYIGPSFKAASRVVMGQGGIQTLVLYEKENGNIIMKTFTNVEANSISIFLQVPQYLVLALAEVLFTITGLEFSYSQAPMSMKSVIQGLWFLSEGFGNLIVIIITEAAFLSKESHLFLFYASLMLVDVTLFVIMAYYYVYVEEEYIESETEIIKKSQTETSETNLGLHE